MKIFINRINEKFRVQFVCRVQFFCYFCFLFSFFFYFILLFSLHFTFFLTFCLLVFLLFFNKQFRAWVEIYVLNL